MPFLVAGIMALLFGLSRPIYRLSDYVAMFVLAYLSYWLSRKLFWRDKITQVELQPDTGDTQADQLIIDAREYLKRVAAANDAIADDGLSRTISSIETGAREVIKRIEEKPVIAGQVRNFLRYYLPTTVKILEARAALEPGKAVVVSKEARETRARTERMLGLVDKAMRDQVGALEKNRYLDVQVEMDVLEGMLKSDGMIS